MCDEVANVCTAFQFGKTWVRSSNLDVLEMVIQQNLGMIAMLKDCDGWWCECTIPEVLANFVNSYRLSVRGSGIIGEV